MVSLSWIMLLMVSIMRKLFFHYVVAENRGDMVMMELKKEDGCGSGW